MIIEKETPVVILGFIIGMMGFIVDYNIVREPALQDFVLIIGFGTMLTALWLVLMQRTMTGDEE